MKSGARFAVFAALVLALNAAGLVWIRQSLAGGTSPRIRVLQALPEGPASDTDRLSLVFHEPIARPEEVGAPPRSPLFTIDPAPAGRWEWAAADRLDYVLEQKLPPGRRYTVRPGPDLERSTGRRILGSTEFTFRTEPLALKDCAVVSADPEAVTIRFTFNQPVSPKDLLKHLTLAAGGERLAPTSLTAEAGSELTVRAPRPRKESLSVEIAKDLTGRGGELPLDRAVARKLLLPTRFAAMRAEVDLSDLSPRGRVTLSFSSDLKAEEPAPEIALRPAVPGAKVELTGRGIIVSGEFVCGQRYEATVPATVLSAAGTPLGESQRLEFLVPERSPQIRIPAWSGVLAPGGNMMLDLQAVNVAKVKLESSRVLAGNLVAHLHGNSACATSRSELSRSVELKTERNVPKSFALDLKSMLGERPGVHRVSVQSEADRWVSDSAVVTVTDLGLTVKRGRGGDYLVWVASIAAGKPVGGVQVRAIAANNQTLAEATTGEDGVARLSPPPGHPDGKPWVVTAERDGDLSYLEMDHAAEILDDIDQGGRAAPTTYDVMLYTERGVYRPGETVHLTGIIRDAEGALPPPFPLSVAVLRPDGRKIADLLATPGEQGLFQIDYPTREEGHTGNYRFRVSLPGADETLGSTSAWVEAFVPARIEVKPAPTQARFGPGETPRVTVAARYLFDQPAAGLKLTVSGRYQPTPLVSKTFPEFAFGRPGRKAPDEFDDIDQDLDAEGKAEVALPAVPDRTPGLWRGAISATVTETGGRSVSAGTSVLVDTAAQHIGLRLPGRVARAGAESTVEWVLLRGDDTPGTAAALEARLFRVEGDAELQLVGGRGVWKWVEREVLESETKLSESGSQGGFPIRCGSAGWYRLVVSEPSGTAAAAQLDFYASESDQAADAGDLRRPERIELLLDQDRYRLGGSAQLIARSPFAGSLLLTLESNRTLSHRVLEVDPGATTIPIEVDPALRGGGFISASLVRPLDPKNEKWLPVRALGRIRLATDPADHLLPITLEAPAAAMPGGVVPVTVRTAAPADPARAAVAHLWAVDDGIIQTTAFRRPDPYAFFLAPRRLEVETMDLYRDLLPDPRRPADMALIGGDGGDEDETLTRSLMAAAKRQSGVVWQRAISLDSTGVGRVELAMPRMTGRMRVYAVVVDQDRYGAAEHTVVLSSPLMVEATWPRFLAPGDSAEVPVKIVNTTADRLEVAVTASPSGPVALSAASQAATVEAGRSVVLWWTVTPSGLGPASVSIDAAATAASGAALAASTSTELVVRPVTTLETRSRLACLKGGEEVTLELDPSLIPGSATTRLLIGPSPMVNLGPAIDSLIDYPYGCVEQTTSRMLALSELPDLLAAESTTRAETVRDMLQAGIARLWSMQTSSGGLAYWPGGREADLWGTVYAAETLCRLRASGLAVDPQFLAMLADYLERRLRADGREEIGENVVAQFCAVLADLGRPQPGWIAILSERNDRLDIAGRAYLARAMAAAGDRDRARSLLASTPIELQIATTACGRLTSKTTQLAQFLWTLLDLDPGHPAIPALAGQIQSAAKEAGWASTVETAAAVSALARYQRSQPGAPTGAFTGTVKTSTGTVPFDSKHALQLTVPGSAGPITLRVEGDGEAHIVAVTRGLGTQLPAPYSRGLELKREWLDRGGKPVDPAKLRAGDLVRVRLTLAAPGLAGEDTAENIAMVDPLPGGMEVENPNLETSVGAARTSGAPQADRVEFLDDRVVIFTAAGKKEREFNYYLRVVTPGRFVVPPAHASSMYDASLAALGPAGAAEVSR